jgi:hypothetical protein
VSTENIYICDRCKKEARSDRSHWLSLAVYVANDKFDLCKECKEKFFTFMKKA